MTTTVADVALLTVAEVADILRLTPDTVYAKVQAKQLAAVRLGPGPRAPIRITADELRRYVEEGLE